MKNDHVHEGGKVGRSTLSYLINKYVRNIYQKIRTYTPLLRPTGFFNFCEKLSPMYVHGC